jgi:putative endonuclease
MEFVTYVLYNKTHDRYYIGHTNNIEIRLKQHSDGRNSWTNRYKPWVVIYQNKHPTRAEAMREERYLKSLKNKERIQEYIKKYIAG